jgi:hypothetical protein
MNSLYGRFGMNDNFGDINIIHKDFIADFENKYFELITLRIKLGEHYLIELKDKEKIDLDGDSTHNINIGIASAITAYARIHMSQFKNNPDFKLYYSDTDSIYIDRPLQDYLVDSKVLGKMKLENICNKVIFISPKVYYLETEKSEIIYKIKGLKHEIELNFSEFKQLLNKDNFLKKIQTK